MVYEDGRRKDDEREIKAEMVNPVMPWVDK